MSERLYLNLDELIVLAAVTRPMSPSEAADAAVELLATPRFDRQVALATVHALSKIGLLRLSDRYVHPTIMGVHAAEGAAEKLRDLARGLERLHMDSGIGR